MVKNIKTIVKNMERQHIAVPSVTGEQIAELREKFRSETGINETNGSIVAKAVNEYYKNIFKK